MSIITVYKKKMFVDVILYLPRSADSREAHIFGFCFYVTLLTDNNAILF